MSHSKDFQKLKKQAKQKQSEGKKLHKNEELSLKDESFFTMVLPIETIEKIVATADEYKCKPGQLVAGYISLCLGKDDIHV